MKPMQSLRSRFLIIASVVVLFWFFCSLLVIDRINNIKSTDHTHNEMVKLKSEMTTVSLNIQKLLLDCRKIETGSVNSFDTKDFEQSLILISNSIININSDYLVKNSVSLQKKVSEVNGNIHEMNILLNDCSSLYYERGDLSRGLINKWYNKLQLLGTSTDFLKYINEKSMNYLNSLNSDFLQEISDRWNLEKEPILNSQNSNVAFRHSMVDFFSITDQLIYLNRKLGNSINNGLLGKMHFYDIQTHKILNNASEEIESLSINYSKKLINFLIWIILIGGLILVFLFSTVLRGSSKSISKILQFLSHLKKGELPENLDVKSGDELEEMSKMLNDHKDALTRKIDFADRIGEGKINPDFKLDGEKDSLGNSLLKLSHNLSKTKDEDRLFIVEDEKRRWISEGMAAFGGILQSERNNLNELAFKIISNLVKYLNANQGAIYLSNKDESGDYVQVIAAFAYERRKYIDKKILYGVGLVGSCAVEKETIYLTEIPENYIEITSGIGKASPRCLLIVPLKLKNELLGIIEIASFKPLEDHEIKFTEQLGESIATTVVAVILNEKTTQLLLQSQKQTEEMALQEEKMKINMHDLQTAQEESNRKEAEITGILNAVNSSSLVAEYSMNGRFSDINDKFLFLLEAPREQVTGKHHSDFAVVDKYSDEYKDFWKKLREGTIISQVEQFKLYNGQELWLNHTYTPILDKNNKPYKILNIAYDITETKKQQEWLENQANEIVRKSIEMEALSTSVDSSIIKAELSPEAIILNVNGNYIEATGYSAKEMLGKNLRLFLKDIEKQQFEKIWSEIIKEKLYTGVIRRTKPTGEEIWLMSTFAPVKDEDGNIYKTYFLAQDITEKKLKYQLLEEANKEVERLRQQLNDLEKK